MRDLYPVSPESLDCALHIVRHTELHEVEVYMCTYKFIFK